MEEKPSSQPEQLITRYKEELDQAVASGDERGTCLAHALLASAYLLDRNLARGRFHFDQGDAVLEKLGDISVETEYLKIKSLAQQIAGHLPEAFKNAERLYQIGEETGNSGLMSDALASQGQTLADSGDPVKAKEKYQQALQIAEELDDKRRVMNLYGGLGNLGVAVGATDSALKDFYQARSLAVELEDKQSEIGYSGSIGTLLAFGGNHTRAIEEFLKVLEYVEQEEDLEANIQALRHLCQSYSKLEQFDQVLNYAPRGIELGGKLDKEKQIFFYEKIILAHYKTDNLEKAQQVTREAIKLASKMKDKSKKVELLIGLGESLALSEAYPEALEIYQSAREGARRLQQMRNEAYLVGRMGIVYAEMGDLDQAIALHQEAITLAQERMIKDLEGEQLSMLAMAYLDQGEYEIAADYAQQSLQLFLDANLLEESEKARSLLTEIKARMED